MQNNYHIIFYRVLQYAIILIALTLRASGQYETEINFFATKYDLPPLLIRAVIRVESNFNPKARNPLPPSRKGVSSNGLMQVNGGSFDVRDNINTGCSILRKCFDAYDGNLLNALTAYNAGIHGAKKYIKRKDYHYAHLVLSWYWKYLWQEIIKNSQLTIKNGSEK